MCGKAQRTDTSDVENRAHRATGKADPPPIAVVRRAYQILSLLCTVFLFPIPGLCGRGACLPIIREIKKCYKRQKFTTGEK